MHLKELEKGMKEMVNRIFLSLLISITIIGCATQETLEEYKPLQVSEFKEFEDYKLDLSELDNEQEIALSGILSAPLYANVTDEGELNIVFDESEANAIVLYSEQYAKISDLVDIAEGYRKVAISQAELIKVKDETIRSLQELVLLQQQSRDIYYQNFQLADKLYKQEHKLRMRENLMNNIKVFTTSIGVIAVAML